MTPLAEALKPYIMYLIYGQIVLVALALMTAAFIILKRLLSEHRPNGGALDDKEKLAAELQEEIIRLKDLRDRLDPKYANESEIPSAPKEPRPFELNDTEEPALAVAPGPSEEEIQKRIDEALKTANQELHKEIATLNEKLAIQTANAGDTQTSSSSPVDEEKLKDLEARIEEYQAFDEEIALVKRYKEENEQLKAQLAGMAKSEPEALDMDFDELKDTTPELSTDDISSLFAEMSPNASNENEEIPEKVVLASKEDPLADLISGLEEEKAADPVQEEPAPETDGADALLAALEAENTQAPVDYQEPILAVNEENAEALAEIGEEKEDELMAEFEKILSSKENTPA